MISRRRLLQSSAALALVSSFASSLAQAAPSLQAVKDRGALRIGVAAADPWFYKDPISEEWSGVGVTIGKLMAEDLGVEFQTVETTWANCVAAIQADQIDLMYVLDATDTRRQAVDFPEAPLFYYALGALIQPDMNVKAWQDLNKDGVRIAVTLGTTIDKKLTEELPNAQIERFASNDESIAAFVSRRVDVVSQFHPALIVQAARIGLGRVVLPTPIHAVPTSVGLQKSDDPSFRDWVNEFIIRIYSDGTLTKIFEEYIATKGIDPKSVPGLVREEWLGSDAG
jgi:polar amino acid transport system substrate-binding protein